MQQRWALYIDIEGFGAKWNDTTMTAFRGINALMQGIYWIGDRYYREPPHRLFAHQFGDGFLIVSDFHEQLLDRATLISVALLRHLLANKETAKCAIAEGQISDIQHCYPREIRDHLEKESISLGHGVMTISPVLGSALIHAVSLAKKSPSGPVLSIAAENAKRLTCGVRVTLVDSDLASLDWLRGEPTGLVALQKAAGLAQYAEDERMRQLGSYIESNVYLKPEWIANANKYLRAIRT
jgi:hypothetical protein